MLYTIGKDHWWLVRPSVKELKGAKRAHKRALWYVPVPSFVFMAVIFVAAGIGLALMGDLLGLPAIAVGFALVGFMLHFNFSHYRYFRQLEAEGRAVNLESGPVRVLLMHGIFTGSRKLPAERWWPVLEDVGRGPLNRFFTDDINRELLALLKEVTDSHQQLRVVQLLVDRASEVLESIDSRISRQIRLEAQEANLLAESRATHEGTQAMHDKEMVDARLGQLGIE